MKKLIHFLIFTMACCTANAGELRVQFRDEDGNAVSDAVIEIISPGIPVPEDWDYMSLMDQVDKEFIDNVILTIAGSKVSFPNSDDIQHHVYSFSDINTFELPLYSGDQADSVLFDTPGIAVVGCNIHDWMLGYIYVGESHLMAKSNDHGIAELSDLPAGNYTFKIWHERARKKDQFSTYSASVEDSGTRSMEINLDLARDRRIRRAPVGTGSSYH